MDGDSTERSSAGGRSKMLKRCIPLTGQTLPCHLCSRSTISKRNLHSTLLLRIEPTKKHQEETILLQTSEQFEQSLRLSKGTLAKARPRQ